MQDGWLPKDTLYGELCYGVRPVGRPSLRYKDVYMRDMKFARINLDYWEGRAADRDTWRLLVKECTSLTAGEGQEGLQGQEETGQEVETARTVNILAPEIYSCTGNS